MKNKLKDLLNVCKVGQFRQPEKDRYIRLKKQYCGLTKGKKRAYEQNIRKNLANTNNAVEFWKTVKSCGPFFAAASNGPSREAWSVFYKTEYPARLLDNSLFFDVSHPYLDTYISFSEVRNCINKLKNGKAPGSDQLRNEFFKALPENWLLYLQVLLNKVFEQERTPAAWSDVQLFMLYKKGDKLDPANYRGITLVNCITKIFTQILCTRLTNWAGAA